MIDSTLITSLSMIVSAIAVSVVFFVRGRSMSGLQRISLVVLGLSIPFVIGLTLGDIPIDAEPREPAEWGRWANLVPFATVGPQIAAASGNGLRQIAGNLLLLGPLGLTLPILWDRFRVFGSTVLVAFVVTLGIEIGQVVISIAVGVPYRAFDVDDLILNTAGAVVGWVAWRLSIGLSERSSGSAGDRG